MPIPSYENDFETLSESETELKKPPLYKVLLHNDDYTTIEFVVYVLRTVFHKNEIEAFTIMMKVHRVGVGIAGVFTYEVAQMKAEKCMNLARANEYPLLCTIEEDS